MAAKNSGSSKETALRLRAAAEAAIECIGLGYDMSEDLRLKYCKKLQSRLIAIDDDQVRDIAIPGGILVQNVPKSIKCDKGERLRFSSDVLSFQQMSEQFNQDVALSGKIPTGHFNAAFEFTGCWQKDAAYTKALAFDGVFITLYSIALEKSQVTLSEHVKQAVPSSWDPAALARYIFMDERRCICNFHRVRFYLIKLQLWSNLLPICTDLEKLRFIEKYGTHVIVGMKMGGKDVVYIKQQYSSPLQPADIQKKLKDVADKRFADASGPSSNHNDKIHIQETLGRKGNGQTFTDTTAGSIYTQNEDMTFFCRRRGGSSSKNLPHSKWCQSVQLEPDVILMSFIPISSLLSGIDGSGFLSHAINLYLRYKPPIEELYQFLEFQLPRQWAPVFGELPLGPDRKQESGASLQFSLMGPKLYVNTNPVDVGNKPLTGLRLYLEGKRSNCLAIHLQHLSSLPKSFQLKNDSHRNAGNSDDRRYFEKVQWKSFSHVCSAPVESDEDLSIVTGAEFEIKESGMKNVLFLRLHFSKVIGASVVKKPEWDGTPVLGQKSGIISTLISTRFSTAQKPPPRPSDVNINSALYPEGPPVPAQTRKLLRYVDTTEMTRGPQDPPGYWVVSGARLVVDNGKISLRVKYSLLAVILPDDEEPFHG